MHPQLFGNSTVLHFCHHGVLLLLPQSCPSTTANIGVFCCEVALLQQQILVSSAAKLPFYHGKYWCFPLRSCPSTVANIGVFRCEVSLLLWRILVFSTATSCPSTAANTSVMPLPLTRKQIIASSATTRPVHACQRVVATAEGTAETVTRFFTSNSDARNAAENSSLASTPSRAGTTTASAAESLAASNRQQSTSNQSPRRSPRVGTAASNAGIEHADNADDGTKVGITEQYLKEI
jgi:hypothetical protein